MTGERRYPAPVSGACSGEGTAGVTSVILSGRGACVDSPTVGIADVGAPVEAVPAVWIAMVCPLCGEHRRYLPTEIFQGRVSWELLKKPPSRAVRRV